MGPGARRTGGCTRGAGPIVYSFTQRVFAQLKVFTVREIRASHWVANDKTDERVKARNCGGGVNRLWAPLTWWSPAPVVGARR